MDQSTKRRDISRRAAVGLLSAVAVLFAAAATASARQATRPVRPNVVIINIDDMGWGDLPTFGGTHSRTPNLDRLAAQGTRFTQFYGASLCSPSRAGLITGQFAARNNINSFIDGTAPNLSRDNADSLPLSAPSMPRMFHDAGYATGHFGKWHLGGGRDVGYASDPTPGTVASAPRVAEYGYDAVWTQFEGLGNRIIQVKDYGGDANGTTGRRPSDFYQGLDQQSAARGTGGGRDQFVYIEREYASEFFADRAMSFIDSAAAAGKPFFVNVWPDDVHTPHDPSSAVQQKYRTLYPDLPRETQNYLAVMEMLDAEIGRIVEHVDGLGLGNGTLFVISADNGAVETNARAIGSNGNLRGGKGDDYEGGIREPLIVRWTGTVPAGQVNSTTVMAMTDFLPSLAAVAGGSLPQGADLDGEDLSAALLGDTTVKRGNDLYWGMNRGAETRHHNGGAEVVALRRGDLKLVMDADGKRPELYDLAGDPGETTNLAAERPNDAAALAQAALTIRYQTPSRILPDTSKPVGRLRAGDLMLEDGGPVVGWADKATGDSVNLTVTQAADADARPTYRANAVNGKGAVQFDGNDHLESAADLSLADASKGITVVAVVTGDAGGTAARRLGQFGDGGGAGGKVAGFDVSTSNTAATNGGAGFRFNDGASLYDTALDASFHIVVWQIAGGECYADAKLYVDGTDAAHRFTGTSANAAGRIDLSGGGLQLLLGTGRNTGGLLPGDSYSGQLAEFLVYDEQLTVGQINLVANSLATEYALPFRYDTSFLSVPKPASAALPETTDESAVVGDPDLTRLLPAN